MNVPHSAEHLPSELPQNYLAATWDRVPEPVVPELRAYFERGALPGAFVRALLENDLYAASLACPLDLRDRLVDLGTFLFVFAPVNAWGAPTIVRNWMAHGGFAGGAHLR